ncbi:MAG TPA: polyphosphate kinase 2 family protein [Lacunisphaera sp.]|nr:polyphosphate kinase 2 family protein [Lacunisphaera sp.]
MNAKQLFKQSHRLSDRYCITGRKKFHLRDISPADTAGLKSKSDAREALQHGVEQLAELQDRLYAEDRRALLVIFQAMDAAGKDGAIKHVMSGVNPQGCEVHAFKAPNNYELDHDYLWRCHSRVPERGRIGIFNRSYYEEVLAVRVHPELLGNQRLPKDCITKNLWRERFADINAFESYLHRNGVVVLKFFLHVSQKEQKRRFLERLDQPEKNWKFSVSDAKARGFWHDYMDAYEDMIRHTSTKEAPWHVIPANNKWFTRLVVAATIVDTLRSLNPKFPEVSEAKRRELAAVRRTLARG